MFMKKIITAMIIVAINVSICIPTWAAQNASNDFEIIPKASSGDAVTNAVEAVGES